MTERDHESRRDEIAAYLLGALEPEESASLERHLEEGCADCQAELLWLEPAVRLLPDSVERVEPSRGLRTRVLAEARADVAPAATRSPRRPLFSSWRPLAGLAALALVLAALGGYAIRSGDSGGGEKVSTVVAGKPPGVTATMVREGDAATLHLANVHQLAGDRVLEAWIRRDGDISPVRGLFVPDSRGLARTTIPDMRGVEVVMVTAEPKGGSEVPTSVPVVTARIKPS